MGLCWRAAYFRRAEGNNCFAGWRTARTERAVHRTRRTSTRSPDAGSRHASRPASCSTLTSTTATRPAAVSARSPRAMTADPRPRSPICARRAGEATSRCAPVAEWNESTSRTASGWRRLCPRRRVTPGPCAPRGYRRGRLAEHTEAADGVGDRLDRPASAPRHRRDPGSGRGRLELSGSYGDVAGLPSRRAAQL